MRTVLLIVVAVLFLLTLGVYGFMYLGGGQRHRAPEDLAKEALNASSDDEKIKAAVALADWADPERDAKKREIALEQMREVLEKSDNPDVRGAVMQGLGWGRDYPSVPNLLKIVKDNKEPPAVRGRAGAAINAILGVQYNYPINSPTTEKDKARQKQTIADWEKEYKTQQNPNPNS